MSNHNDEQTPEEILPWAASFNLDNLPAFVVQDPETGEDVAISRQTMAGALVAYAMDLQERLGMPFTPPQQAVEEMGLSWRLVQLALPRFEEMARGLVKTPGRPRKEVNDRWSHPGSLTVAEAIRDYLYENPGAASRNAATGRTVYSEGFRDLVLGLLGPGGPGAGMNAAQVRACTGVPARTLALWQGRKLGKRGRRK